MLSPQNIGRLKRFFEFWIKETDIPVTPDEKININAILTFESLSLFLRYIAIFVILICNILGIISSQDELFSFFILICLGSITFTHLVFYYEKYSLLTTPFNFFLHLLTITTAIAITGSENSPLFLAYPLFQYAYLVYAQKKAHPFITSLVVIIFYNFVVIGTWLRAGLQFATFILSVQILFLFLSGVFSYLLFSYIQNIRFLLHRKDQELLYTQGIIKSILDSFDSAIIIFDEREIITEANTYASSFLNMPPEELIGKRVRSLFFDDTLLGEQLLSLRSNDHLHIDALVLTPKAEEIPVTFVVQSFYQNNQRFFLGIMIDRREQKQLQETFKWIQKQREELESQIRRTRELRISFSKHFITQSLTYFTILKNILICLLSEKAGPVSEKQKIALQIGKKALDAMEAELIKEFEIEDVDDFSSEKEQIQTEK